MPGARRVPASVPASVLRHRRAAALIGALVMVALTISALLWAVRAANSAGRAALGAFGGVPASASEGATSAARSAPLVDPSLTPLAALPKATAVVVVVAPGDTIWSLARRVQPSGDIRPLVARIAARNGGADLRVGDRLVIER